MRTCRSFVVFVMLLGVASGLMASSQTLFLSNSTANPANNIKRVVVSHDPRLIPSGGITLEAWIRPSNLTGCQTILGKDFRSGYWLGICGGNIRFYTAGAGTSQDSANVVPVSTWSHIAVSFDGTVRRYFLNGEQVLSSTTPGPIGVNAAALGIGGEGASPIFPDDIFPFTGYLSEVRIWSYARTQTQIRGTMYKELSDPAPGLIGLWSFEGGPDDRFGNFSSVLVPGSIFSGLDSPPVYHDPLRIPSTSSINSSDGACTDSGYTTAARVPAWYPTGDIPLGERNPLEILLGASSSYLYVCFPDRAQLNDPIWTVEIDTDNDGSFTLDSDDYRFRLWVGQDGLTTARGRATPPFGSTWDTVTNPSGLTGVEEIGAEFVTDMEFRIPRSLFADPGGLFRIRVAHNYLTGGGATDETVEWPQESNSTSPSTWEPVVVDLTAVGPADYRNPRIFTSIANDMPRFFEEVQIRIDANDDSDIELIELLVDGSVVESRNFTGSMDRDVSFTHTALYPPGNHSYQARVFDQAGRERDSLFKSFRVLVDGNPPEVRLSVDPISPLPGQTVTLNAWARDSSGVQFIIVRDVLGTTSPGFRRCDFAGSGAIETCSWTITPDPRVSRLRVDALATDSEGFSDSTTDRVILFGNTGSDRDNDGLADSIEAGMCTDPDDPDTDRDGLSDSWEVLGIQFDNGDIEQLTDYGVNPCWKNALLQLDYETGAAPPASGMANLRNRYRDAGINVYLELNERPAPTAYPQSHIGAASAVYQTDGGDYYFDPKRTWAFYYGYERNLAGRSGAWNRLFTVDHNFGSRGFCSGGDKPGAECRGDFECPGAGASCAAGCTGGTREGMSCSADTDCPNDDGSFSSCSAPCTSLPGGSGPACGTIGDLPYRLFHEFGHTVGLGHGGRTGTRDPTIVGGFVFLDNRWDSRNYKPNHQSAMNYAYSQGSICMEPLPASIPDGFSPSFIGELTYMTEDLGDLNENSLSESSSLFATRLRSRDCSFASPTAFPVFKYTCKFGSTQYEVISDGFQTLARRPKDGDWDYDPPSPTGGIDWNCNGSIDSGTVDENINGPSFFRADGFWDEGAWNKEDNLNGRREFQLIPNPADCQLLYTASCKENRSQSCYVWPAGYRNAIPNLITGMNPVDCRDVFLNNRGGECGGGSDSEFGTGTCPSIFRDTPVTTALNEKMYGGFDDHAGVEPSFDSDQFIQVTDNEVNPPTPGVESCDLIDNDGDGLIDESCADTDSDGIPDSIDNCVTMANADQADRDLDGLGDICQEPAISGLIAAWDGNQKVTLSWNGDGVPALGYAVYRVGESNPDSTYRGGPYPSALGESFEDAVSFGDTFTYAVHPINLNGEEAEPMLVTVTVDIAEIVFADSFED